MSKLRIVTNNYTDVSSLTGNPVALDINNLKTYSRSKNLVIPDTVATQEIKMQLGSASTVSAIILGRHNFVEGMTLRIYLYSDSVWTSQVYDSTLLTISATEAGSSIVSWGSFIWGSIPWGLDSLAEVFAPKASYVHWITPGITSVLSMKIVIYNNNVETTISRLFVGDYIEPTFTLSANHTLTWTENTKQIRSGGDGTLRSTFNIPTRELSFSIDTINATDRPILQNAFRYVGTRKDLFISLFPSSTNLDKLTDYSGLMKVTKLPSISEYAPIYYKSTYTMEEV